VAEPVCRRPDAGGIGGGACRRDAVPLRPDAGCHRRLRVHREPRLAGRARLAGARVPSLRILPALAYRLSGHARARPGNAHSTAVAVTPPDLVGELDPNFAWDGGRMYGACDFAPGTKVPLDLRGAAASLEVQSPSSWRIVRDPLGINKLFWAAGEDGRVALASRPKRLLEERYAFSSVRAIPRGSVIELAESRPEPDVHRIAWRAEAIPGAGLTELAAQIKSTLARYLG